MGRGAKSCDVRRDPHTQVISGRKLPFLNLSINVVESDSGPALALSLRTLLLPQIPAKPLKDGWIYFPGMLFDLGA